MCLYVCFFSKRPHRSRATVSLKTNFEFASARPGEARNGKRAWRCKVLHSSKARIQAERPVAGPRGGQLMAKGGIMKYRYAITETAGGACIAP